MAPQSNVTTKSNPELVTLIHDLKRRAGEHDAPVWRDVARRLEKPTRQHVAVNVSDLERHLQANDVAVVPGKVLAAGSIAKPVKVAAFQFSGAAREKITKAGGSCLTLAALADENPKGSKVRIIG